jgi:hypothetical protein
MISAGCFLICMPSARAVSTAMETAFTGGNYAPTTWRKHRNRIEARPDR